MTEAAFLKQANTALSGMTAIRDFCRSINLASSEASVISMIIQCGFPARKIGGIWESDKEKIVEWRKKYVSGEVEEKPPTVQPEKKPSLAVPFKKNQQNGKRKD